MLDNYERDLALRFVAAVESIARSLERQAQPGNMLVDEAGTAQTAGTVDGPLGTAPVKTS